MSLSDQARKLATQARQHQAQIEENMLERANEQLDETLENTEAQARELITQARHHQAQIEENILERTSEEIEPEIET